MILEYVFQIQLRGERTLKLLYPRRLVSYSVEHKLRERSTSLSKRTKTVYNIGVSNPIFPLRSLACNFMKKYLTAVFSHVSTMFLNRQIIVIIALIVMKMTVALNKTSPFHIWMFLHKDV